MFCEKCGSQIDEGKKICPNCGILKQRKKFCQHCGQMIDFDCVVCTSCGKQVEELKVQQPQVVVNNVNTNTNLTGAMHGQRKKKWVAFLLCLFLGIFGAHKFYEGKIMMRILYIFTGGLLSIGVIVDLIAILLKPNPYYV